MDERATRWSCEPYDVAAAVGLARSERISPVLASLLVRRGLSDPAAARRFLDAADRHPPLELDGMAAARDVLLDHARRGSRMVVHGDYDVDGVCSTAILVRALRTLGAEPRWELPSRFDDGYGLSSATIERLAAQGADLLVTVDCGITSVGEVAAARSAGIDVVVTDHHRPGAELPGCPIVHPALGGYPCPELCAAGVALKLAEALYAGAGRDPLLAEEDLDLAALATICDLVPLRGENRRIAREGLRALSRTTKPGLRALMEVAKLEQGSLDEGSVGFRLGPRLNAAGRMQRADAALELLLTGDAERAKEVADELDGLNHDRREAETRMLFEADAACREQASAAALVVAGEGWHPGVVGIVASRLVERWCRPAVVISLDEQGSGRGSGRSIPAFDLHAGLAACSEHLTRFGGHRVAAGLELAAGRLPEFRAAFARAAGEQLAPGDLLRCERVDAVVPGGALGLSLAEELERLRPFGPGNPQPTLLVPAARVEDVAAMGEEGRHARFTLTTGGARSRGVAFGAPPRSLGPAREAPHDLAVRLERNVWNGAVEPRVVLRAKCPTRPGALRVVGEEGGFWTRLEAELRRDPARQSPSQAAADIVDRRGEGFAGVAGDLLTSGQSVLVAVADVARRRSSLGALVAGLAPEGLSLVSWSALAEERALAAGYDQLLAFDPPPLGPEDQLLAGGGPAHLAWGAAEQEFALAAYGAELELRPALADAWRALRGLGAEPESDPLERALRGNGRHARTPECCGRLVRVLSELGLLEYERDGVCRVLQAERTELERSPAYRAYQARLARIQLALRPPAAAPLRAA